MSKDLSNSKWVVHNILEEEILQCEKINLAYLMADYECLAQLSDEGRDEIERK